MIRNVEIGWRQGETEGAIRVEVVYSRRRTLGLEVRADGRVILRAPKGLSNQAVMDFVKERQAWIVQKWFETERIRRQKAERPPRDYEQNPALEAQYRKEARRRITERAAYFAEKMGVDYGRIAIKAAKTRWGSCSARGNLNFHWKLILMPPAILDYVVVHELAHRIEMNHSPRFWAQVERILPDYRERRRWLKENGGTYLREVRCGGRGERRRRPA